MNYQYANALISYIAASLKGMLSADAAAILFDCMHLGYVCGLMKYKSQVDCFFDSHCRLI